MAKTCFVEIAKEYIQTAQPQLIARFQEEVMLFMISQDVNMIQNDAYVSIRTLYDILTTNAPALARALKVAVGKAYRAIKNMDATLDSIM
jgi:hypothetical protein